MTNYNERLDEVIDFIENYGVSASTDGFDKTASRAKAKQALTSLFKELVAEAKPRKYQKEDFKGSEPDRRKKAFNRAIDQFEQNLLKALEEV